MTGSTQSPGLASGGFQDTLGAGNINSTSAFLVKFDANGNRLWATYYSGEIGTIASSVATDASGNVYMAGFTFDTAGVASGGFQNTYGGNEDAFLVKFDANGNRLWATYYGGAGQEAANSVTIDAVGNVYLAGQTNSSDSNVIASSGGFQTTYGAGIIFNSNAFLVKFDANGNRIWATYYGGAGRTEAMSVATDATGNVYIGGTTISTDSIASGGFQDTLRGNADAFLVKFDSNGNRIWATYYGGVGSDGSNSIATDATGNVYIGGTTTSTNSIASAGFQDTLKGNNDAFLVKFDGAGNRLWATYYGDKNTNGWSVGTDAVGNVFLAGTTNTCPSTNIGWRGFQDSCIYSYGDAEDLLVFLVKFDTSGNRQCATYYGQIEKGQTTSLTLDNAQNVYLASNTEWGDSYADIASGGFQMNYAGPSGGYDAYLVKFCPCSNCIIAANFQSSDSTFCSSECINYTDLSINATSWQWSFPGGTPSSSTIQNPQGICYDSAGTFDSRLIASNGTGTDTLTFTNHIKVFASPPTPVIRQHHDSLFCTTDPTYTSYQWYDSTTLIPGATDTFLVVTHGGNYNVAVTNEFGCKISVGITIANNVGINEFSTNNYISLSPNPAFDQLTIHISYSHIKGTATLSIINLLGQEMLSCSLLLGRGVGGEAIYVGNLPSGIYFVQVAGEKERWAAKFIKE